VRSTTIVVTELRVYVRLRSHVVVREMRSLSAIVTSMATSPATMTTPASLGTGFTGELLVLAVRMQSREVCSLGAILKTSVGAGAVMGIHRQLGVLFASLVRSVVVSREGLGITGKGLAVDVLGSGTIHSLRTTSSVGHRGLASICRSSIGAI
jgi:hypothetical protein